VSETKLARNKMLVGLFREVLATASGPMNTQDICREIARRRVDRYYLSEERGYQIYTEWISRYALPGGSEWSMRMYVGYIAECDRLVKAGLNPRQAAREAIYKEACCVGLAPISIYDIINDERNKRKVKR
jgi:hypothetical protein